MVLSTEPAFKLLTVGIKDFGNKMQFLGRIDEVLLYCVSSIIKIPSNSHYGMI